MKKVRQNGFTLIEGLLIVVALSLVVGVGYYIYGSNKNKSGNNLVTTQPSTSASDKGIEPAEKDYLVMKEFGLRFNKAAIPTANYKVAPAERERAYPNVPELTLIQFYDSAYDNLKNSKGETCGSYPSDILVVEIMTTANRDKKYANYKNALLGPNDEVPTVVSDKYAKKVGDYLYDYYKAQGVQEVPNCVTTNDDSTDQQILEKFQDSYSKLEYMVSTIEKS